MNTKQVIDYAKIFIGIVAFVVITALIFDKCNGKNTVPSGTNIITTEKVLQDINKDKKNLIITLDSLDKSNMAYKNEAITLRKQLAAAQHRNKQLSKQAIPFDKVETQSTNTGDDYYSKDDYIRDLQSASVEADSLCMENLNNLDSQIKNRDSVITRYQAANNNLQSSINTLAGNYYLEKSKTIALTDVIRTTKRKLKVNKVEKWLLRGLAIYLGAKTIFK
jgi:hypothetical protein